MLAMGHRQGAVVTNPDIRAILQEVQQLIRRADPPVKREEIAVTVQAMGYFWVGTSKIDDWTSLATGQLGLQATDRGGAMRAFRMDDRKQRVIFDGGRPDGEQFFGWEVADA